MKKVFCLLLCLSTLFLTVSGCQQSAEETTENSSKDKLEITTDKEKKDSTEEGAEKSENKKVEELIGNRIENSTEIKMQYANNGYKVTITDPKKVKELEDLINDTEYTKSEIHLSNPLFYIDFIGEKYKSRLIIDNNDVIHLDFNGNLSLNGDIKSKEIRFQEFYSIYKDEIEDKSEESLDSFIGEKLENSVKATIQNGYKGKIKHVRDKEQVKDLEDLFNESKFSKSARNIELPLTDISIYSRDGVIRFYVGANNVIRLEDGRHLKSNEITQEKILAIKNGDISNSSEVKVEEILGDRIKVDLDKIENTKNIDMHISLRSSFAHIKKAEQIKELEDLFNEAEFYKAYEPRYSSGVRIIFYGENGTKNYTINKDDIIKLGKDNYVKSDQITYEKLYSICDQVLKKGYWD